MARYLVFVLVVSLVGGACQGYHNPDPCWWIDCPVHWACVDSSGEAVCTCEQGYAGDLCDECGEGYHDEDGECVVNETCESGSCSGHGTCDDSSGVVACACDDGWGGPYCSIEWVAIPGGTFMMGSDYVWTEQPVHQVTVPAFEMNRTEVTVAQYQSCVDAGECSAPADTCDHGTPNWGVAGRDDHPVNCVDWFQAVDFCSWVGGRLPSEAEWEYAARGGGQDITYPWGDDPVSCTYAVIWEGGPGCGMNRTWAVCSKPAGNTAHGLCDMSGNIWEWVQDWGHDNYNGAPSDGSAWEDPIGISRVARGGNFYTSGPDLRASGRYGFRPSALLDYQGFRCAR